MVIVLPGDKFFEKQMLRALWVTRGKQQPLEVLAGLGILQPVLSAVPVMGPCVQLGGQKEDFKD